MDTDGFYRTMAKYQNLWYEQNRYMESGGTWQCSWGFGNNHVAALLYGRRPRRVRK